MIMRLLVLTPSLYDKTGDAINERQLIVTLAKKVARCYVITLVHFASFFKREEALTINFPENVTVIPLPFSRLHTLITYSAMVVTSIILSIIGLLVNALGRLDGIYIRNSFFSVGFCTFNSLSEKTIVKIPAIIEDEIPDRRLIKGSMKRLTNLFDRLALSKAKKIATNSELFYQTLISKRGFSNEPKLITIPPGVDLHLIKEVKQKRIKRLVDREKIGFIGSLSWWQGVDNLVKACSVVKKDLSLLIIGDGEQRLFIEQLCKMHKLDYEITGFLPHKKALEKLASLKMLVLSSKRISSTELNIPIKIIEAWALRVPVIVTHHRIFVNSGMKDSEHLLYCENTANDIAKQILRLSTDRNLRLTLSRNGYKLAEKFTYDKIAEKLLTSFKV